MSHNCKYSIFIGRVTSINFKSCLIGKELCIYFYTLNYQIKIRKGRIYWFHQTIDRSVGESFNLKLFPKFSTHL